MLTTIDVNKKHQVALVVDDPITLIGARYVPLCDAPPTVTRQQERDVVYVRQAHYVARTKACGLTVTTVLELLDGWNRLQEWGAFGVRKNATQVKP